MKIPKPKYSQYRVDPGKGRWYITVGEYHISEVGFEKKSDAIAWFKRNAEKLFGDEN